MRTNFKKIFSGIILVVVFSVFFSVFSVSAASQKTLKGGSSVKKAVTASKYGVDYVGTAKKEQTFWYKFKTKNYDAFYTFTGKNLNSDSWTYFYLCTKNEENVTDGFDVYRNGENSRNLKLKKNTWYYIKIVCKKAGNYKFNISCKKDTVGDTLKAATTVKTGKSYCYSIDGTDDQDWFKFKVSKTGDYRITFKNLNIDGWLYGYLFTKYEEQLYSHDSYKNGENSQIVRLKKNTWYYVKLTCSKTGNYKFSIVRN
jgi:hypothetical protein